MRKTLLVLAIAASLMLAPGLLQTPAEAGISWSIGSVFSVGGLDFALVFGSPYGFYGDAHFYRTHRPLRYHGYSCHGACSYRAGYYYHHPNCSIVRHHFRRHSFHPDRYWRGAPWHYGRGLYWDRHRHHHRYDRHRYDRFRYDKHRYDRHRGHRHRYYRDHDHDSDSDSDRYDRRRRGRGDHHSSRYDRDRGGWDDDRRRSAADTRSGRRGRGRP